MSDCDDQNNKKPSDDGSTVATTTVVMPVNAIRDGLIQTTTIGNTPVIFLSLKLAGMGQGNALLTFTSVNLPMSLPIWK